MTASLRASGGLRRAIALCAICAALPLAACSGDPAAPAGPAGSPPTSAATGVPASQSGLTASRWWSTSASRSGSVIDPADPTAAAGKLSSSRPAYCAMLRQTIGAGRSILPGVTSTDPALLTATTAFVAELRAVAPSELSDSWRTLGDLVLTLVRSNGDLGSAGGADAVAVRAATSKIAADATEGCHVDISRRVPTG